MFRRNNYRVIIKERTAYSMGMSASQARFLSLTARKTNVEYEGQQINQQRTTLSNESSNYYSQLTSMAVPVPPSTADYTRITYTFNDGSAKNTITSLVATKNTAKSGLYMLNYVQEIPSHNMVVNGTSVVTKTNDKYNIGTVELQEAGNNDYSINKFTKAGIPYEVVVAMSEEERKRKLAVEQQYVAMASEKYATDDWLVRYQRNSSTGSYEAVLYSLKELQNADYNQKTGASLSGIRQYVFGETTESREIKNAQAKLTQDATGRYQTITIFDENDITSNTTQGDIRTDAQKNAAELWKNSEPKKSDYIDSYSIPELYQNYIEASAGCRPGIDVGNILCFRHILGHMLDLTFNSAGEIDRNAYPKTFASSISTGIDDVDIAYWHISSGKIHERSIDMLPLSNAVRDGYTPDGKSKKYTLLASQMTNTNAAADRLLSDYYLRQGNPTDMQKLLSNYTVANGQIVNKTLEQKCIDLIKAADLFEEIVNSKDSEGHIDTVKASQLYSEGALELDYNMLKAIFLTIDNEVQTFSLNDEDGYNAAMEQWQNQKPSNTEPVIGDIITYNTNGVGTTYNLTCTTESDDAAYNQAMNQYYYDKAQYDQMVQNVNAKIEIIQVQDKNLELKLKQLDTEQNAIQTEMDAVKKVISKNVESSFKTFNA